MIDYEDNTMLNRPAPLMLAALAALTLGACEVRNDADGDGVDDTVVPANATGAPEPGDPPSPEPSESESPVASIIRDDARVEAIEPPAEPLSVTIPFGDSGNDLSERAERTLAGVLQSRALEEGWPVTLRGHTDSGGDDRANLRASRARAEAVAAWLVERGVDDDRIAVIAFGEQNPIAPNARPDGEPNEAGRARNRRVDIEIAPAQARPAPSASPTGTPSAKPG